MKRVLSILLVVTIMICCLPIPSAYASGNSADGGEIETVGIGGGGAFFIPMVNPTDPDNYLVTCDMGGLYWSLDAGKTWSRTESRFWLREAMVSDDGTVFCGAYGLYASYDKGATLQRIYPKDIKHAVSRCGWSEELLLADDYNNGYIKCIATYGDRVYFITLDWYGEMRLVSCRYDGTDVVTYFTRKTDVYDNPVSGVACHMVAEDDGLLYTFGNELRRYDLSTGEERVIYSTSGTLNDLEKIDKYYFILDNIDNSTAVLYSNDLASWIDLSARNTLDPTYTKWGKTYTIGWNFNDICGNSFDSIFLSYNSDAGEGVLHFDGSEFHWVLDKYHKDRSCYGIDGWSYGCYGPFYGICSVDGDDRKCLAATIETVYELDFDSEQQCAANSLHCTSYDGGTYATTGLDVQTAYDVYEDPFDSDHIIICTTDMGLQISQDGGNTWKRHSITDHWDLQNTCYDLYFDPVTEGKVYALWSSRHDAPYDGYTSDKVWTEGAFAVSYDGGMTWDFDNYSTGLPADSIPVKMFVQNNGDECTIAVACFNYGFYISYDSGRHFTSISGDMQDYQGFIWGEDVVIDGDTVYCLTSWHRNGGNTPGKLYTYNLHTGVTDWIDLGDIVIPRSLTWDVEKGLYLNVVPYYRYEWRSEWNDGTFVNYGGGVYHLEDGEFVQIFEDEYGVFNSAFAPDGTLYIASLTGAVYAMKDGNTVLFADHLFPNLKNISFTGGNTMYVTSLGGGTYRMKLRKSQDTDEPIANTGGASIYCWDPYLLNEDSYPAWQSFLKSLGIKRVYQSLEAGYLASGWVNDAVARLGADGIETVLLLGDRSWGLSSCDLSEYKEQVHALAEYNSLAQPDEQIHAVALDVETYTYSSWKNSPARYFEAYSAKMQAAYDYAHSNGLDVVQVIPTHFDSIDSAAFASFATNCSDELSLMNYDKAYQVDSISGEVQISRDLGRKVETIFETMPYNENYSVTENNTYFYEGYEALKDKWSQIEQRYDYDDLTVSYHHLPTVFHVVTGDYLAEIYAYTDSADPTVDWLGQPGALKRIVLTGDNGDVITAGVYNPNYGADYPETCFLAVGVKPGVTYTISDPDGNYQIAKTKTFSFEEGELVDYTSISVKYTGTVPHVHDPEIRDAKPSTCSAEGYTGDTYCRDCGELLTKGSVISKQAHEESLTGKVSATCTAAGYTGDVVCAVCGELISSGSIIPKKAHEPGSAVCNADGTHRVSCKLCGTVLTEEKCSDANRDGICDKCSGSMPSESPSRIFVKKTAFTTGKQYLILLSGKGFGADFKAKAVTMAPVSGGFKPTEEIASDMLWTYRSGKLSCVSGGTEYYLKAEPSGSSAAITLTTSPSQASVWSISSGKLSTSVSIINGKKAKDTTVYLYASGSSVLLTKTKTAGVTLYETNQ